MSTKAIFGGLLSGVGEGLVSGAERRREDALRRAAEMREDLLEQQDRDFRARQNRLDRENRSEEAERDRSHRRGLLSRVDTDAEGNRIGITSGADTVDLGYQAPMAGAGGSGSGGAPGDPSAAFNMAAEEKRVYDEVKNRYTDPNTGRVDWQGMIGHLRDMPEARGGARWNEIADYLTGGVGTNMTEAEAREQAEQEARSRTGLFSSRESEFEETGGDREAWIDMRTRELIGGQPSSVRDAGRSSAPVGGGQPASRVSGSGTQADPYRASTQADIDWFLEQAPAGAVIEVNGTLYTK